MLTVALTPDIVTQPVNAVGYRSHTEALVQQRWILTARKKWHAWQQGSRRSLCGRLTADTLREAPALDVADQLQPEAYADACKTCRELTGVQQGPSPDATPTEVAWLGFLEKHVGRLHVQASSPALKVLAKMLAEVGPPGSLKAQDVFTQIKTLLLTPINISTVGRRGECRYIRILPCFKDAVDKIPNTDALLHIANALRCWRKITGLEQSKISRPDQVISVILQVPTPEPYVRHLNARGLPNLQAMFHPNTLARARNEAALRGVFRGSNDYWTRTTSQLNIVTE